MSLLEVIFNIVLIVCVASLMVSAGLVAEPKEIIGYFKGPRLVLTLRVIFANIVVIPAMTLLLICFFPMTNSMALILFLLAIAPAAPLVPVLVQMNRGDIHWAISLMFVLTFISLLSIPGLIYLGAQFFQEKLVFKPISTSILLYGYVIPVFAPLFLGMALKQWATPIGEKIFPTVDKLGKYLNLPLIVLITILNRHEFAQLNILTTVLLLCFIFGLSILGALSVYSKANETQYITVIVTTGLRNFGIIFLLLNLLSEDRVALLQTTPVSLLVIVFFMITGWIFSLEKFQRV